MPVPAPRSAASLPRHMRWFALWTWRRGMVTALITVAVMAVAYAMSAGPAMLMIGYDDRTAPIVALIYRPLLVVRYLVGGHVKDAIDAYMNMWDREAWFLTKYEFSVWREASGFGPPPSSVGYGW